MNLREYAKQQNKGTGAITSTGSIDTQQAKARKIFRKAFDYYIKHTNNAPKTLEQWETAGEELITTINDLGGGTFTEEIFSAVYDEIRRMNEKSGQETDEG